MRASQGGPAIGLIAQLLLLAVLAVTAGLGAAGWVVGAGCAAIIAAALARALPRGAGDRLGPASWVTLARATLAVGVAGLVADSFARDTPVALLVALSAVALALDAADGWLARRTGTASALGARFDGEVDAFLILVLSVYVAQALGAWVLAIGAARYLFLAGEWLLPWMRAPLPPRRWRRVVAAMQGIVLTIAAAGVLPRAPVEALLLAALAALAVSHGECLWWLWQRRRPVPARPAEAHAPRPGRGPLPAALAGAISVLAVLFVWLAFAAPNHPRRLTVDGFAQLPLELLVVVALAVLLPATARRVLAVVVGAVLSALVLVKVLDLGFFTAFDRPFDPVYDWGYAGIGVETLRDAVGTARANLALGIGLVIGAALLVLPVLALLRVTRVAAHHRGWALPAALALGVVWVGLRVLGAPVASTSATALAVREVRAVERTLQDHDILAREIARDRFRATPGDRLLKGLRGKDVVVVFVESYGRSAVQGASFSPHIRAVLDQGSADLRSSGIGARSAFMASPTFGGISWLAHATLQSGVWVNRRRRYDQLMRSDRLTLSRLFERAGWRAVAVMPQNKRAWKQGSTFYHYDRVYDRRSIGYRGPPFGLPAMPDQYALLALQRHELARRHRPALFAEVDLISSHAPWTSVPRLVPWDDLGDGSIFHRLPAQKPIAPASSGDADRTRAMYGTSIAYSLRAIVSFVRRYGDDDLVLVVLGDHQPATTITGQGPSHDVPISVIARDPKVLDRIAGWGWRDGLRPSGQTPVWPMHAFRDQFLLAFGSTPGGVPPRKTRTPAAQTSQKRDDSA